MNRISRAAELLQRLGDPFGDGLADVPVRPTIKIFSTCTRLIECIPALQHDPHRPEDVLKWDIDEDGNGGDDPYDALGMGLLVKRIVRVKPATAGARQASGFRMV
jgi:phage terminase large subunit